jgi:anti-sigma factor RsiW
MTCREVIGILDDYLESMLTPEVCDALERHLAGCAPCVAYLRTYRATKAMAAEAAHAPMPEELKARLREFLLERLRRV